MVVSTTRPGVTVSPVILARSDALRAVRYLRDVRTVPWRGDTAIDRSQLEAALGAALALQADVQDALAALDAVMVDADLPPTLQRAQDGDR